MVVADYRKFGIQSGAKSVRLNYDEILEAAKQKNNITVFCDLQGGINKWIDKAGWVLHGGIVQVFEVDVLPGNIYRSEYLASAEITDSGTFMVAFPWTPVNGPPVPPDYESGEPDLIFLFTQNTGAVETVYEEVPQGVLWNVASGSVLEFVISSELAVWSYPAVGLSSIPNNELFLFTRIGNYETAETDCRGSSPTSSGYYHARSDGFSTKNSDMPFGRTLDLFGWFGKNCNIAYYKVQYSTDAGTTWNDIKTSLPNKWYDTSDPNPLNWHWKSQSMGPFTVDGVENLYTIPFLVRPDTPWSYLDRIIRFNSTLAPDGLCQISIVPYTWNSDHTHLTISTNSEIEIDANYGTVILRIDNSAPEVKILNMKLNGAPVSVCSILDFDELTDEIEVDFRVWDENGHLRDYALESMYGHNCYVSPRPVVPDAATDNYDSNASGSPLWQGKKEYITEYLSSAYNVTPTSPCTVGTMPTCAYQFRLHASKRTSNGYGLIYRWVEDTRHVTIQK
jgi:hypothetical protein